MWACRTIHFCERGLHAGEDASKDQHCFPDCRQIGKAPRRIPETLRAFGQDGVRAAFQARQAGSAQRSEPIEQLEARLPKRLMTDVVKELQPHTRFCPRERVTA